MRPRRTFHAIIAVLQDGAWHLVEDLDEATRFPAEWVEELQAEGIVETIEQLGGQPLVRLSRAALGTGTASCGRFSYLSRGRLSWEYASKENL